MAFHITCVCLGNICRSPIAAAVLRSRIAAAANLDDVVVNSAGTADWHAGRPMDPRSAAVLRTHGYPVEHAARHLVRADLDTTDLVLVMDVDNYRTVTDLTPATGAAPVVAMLRSYDPALTGIWPPDRRLDVPDPYYGDPSAFTEVLHMIEKAVDGLVDGLLDQRRTRLGPP